MSAIDQLAKDLYKTISESDEKKVKPYDTKAEVLRVEGNTVWVKIPGGIDETPVQRTNNATPGDTVMVRVAGGRAWVAGNNTSPATDDTVAYQAYDVGMGASVAADRAIEEAGRAMTAADQAEVEAGRAKQSADEALENAEIAQESADSATFMLSEIEKIVDVLNWIGEHGTYKPTNDSVVIGGKLYFSLTGTAIANPSGNPSASRYYELINHLYVLSTDTDVDPTKTYYTVIGSPGNPILDPKTEGFYELNEIDSAVSSYISSHLILDDEGLKLTLSKNRSSYLLLTPDGGMTIYRNGKVISKYGEETILGNKESYHIEMRGGVNAELGFYSGDGEEYKVAYINGNQLYIPQVVVVTSMQVGDEYNNVGAWRWILSDSGSMGLYWIGGIS